MKPIKCFHAFKNLLLDSCTDSKGAISIYLAASIFALVGLSGIATDTARAYLVKSRLSTALDAAGLAGGANFYLDSRDADVLMYFNINYPDGYMGSTLDGPHITASDEEETLTLQATASVPTLFMRLFSKDSIDVYSFAEIKREMQALDVTLAIDMSGSMTSSLGAGTRISSAREAAIDLVDIMFGDDETKELFNIGLVPWNGKVNISLEGSTFDPDEITTSDVVNYTNPVSGLVNNETYNVNNSPVPLLWKPHPQWQGCVYSRYKDDDDEDTNGDAKELAFSDFNVDWLAWEPVGPGSEPASSNGSDIEIIQSSSTSNKSDEIQTSWPQTPKQYNILVAIGTRASGDQFNTKAGWISLTNQTADDGGTDRYIRVFAKIANASETSVTLNSDTTAHQGMTILEVANINWNDLVDGIRFSDHTEHARNYVSLNSLSTNNTGDLLIAVAALSDDDYTSPSWTNSFTQLAGFEQSGDGANDLSHGVAYRRVTSNGTYSTTLSTNAGNNAETWGLIIALEDRHVCTASQTGSECTKCLSHGITPLTNTKTTITSAINALQNPEGTTNITEGLSWAWRVLTPDAPFTEAVENPDYNRQQAVVLLTDGENYGGIGDGYKTIWGHGSSGRDEMDDRLRAASLNMKNDGIVLYVIQFANNETALQTLLKEVASGPDAPYYHYAPDAATLQSVFRTVANDLSQLRLSK